MCFDNRRVHPFARMEDSIRVDHVTKIFKGASVLAISPRVGREVSSVRASGGFTSIPVLQCLRVAAREASFVPILMDHPIY